MRTIQMILPPRFGFIVLAVMTCLWSQQHPVSAYADSGWILPVETPAQLISSYRAPATAYAAGHRGVDYRVREAQPIFAPTDAEVRFVGKIADKNVLSLVHSQGYRTSFEPVCSDMFAGQRVKKGDVIGRVCLLGYKSHCKVTCLHYGMRIGENYLSPLALAGAIAPSHTVHYARG